MSDDKKHNPNPRGNPSTLRDNTGDYSYITKVLPKLELITGWARNGLSNTQIALNLGVGFSTLNKMLPKEPALKEALLRGRQDAEVLVENALFKRAVGFRYKEMTKELKRNDQGKLKFILTKGVQKMVVADVNAAIYWLEHRAPGRWAKEKWRADLEERKLAILEKKFALLARDFGHQEDDEDDGFVLALKAAAKEVWENDAVTELDDDEYDDILVDEGDSYSDDD